MSKRGSLEIKKKILSLVKDNELSFAQLERKVNTGYRTIKSNCEELELYGFVKVIDAGKHPVNGRPFFLVKITESGREFLRKD